MPSLLAFAAVAVTVASPEPAALFPHSPAAVQATPAPADRPAREDDVAETLRFATRDKVDLQASYFAPRLGKGEVAPGAVLLHDAGSDRAALDELADALRRRGFGVLTVDLRGHGASVTADLDWNGLGEPARATTWALALRDVEAALQNLRERKEIHSTNVVLVGVGAAGNLALKHAVDANDVRAVALIAPARNAFGMTTANELRELAGLPTMIIAAKESRELAEELQTDAHRANDGHAFVELAVLAATPDAVLQDKRLSATLTKWLAEKVE